MKNDRALREDIIEQVKTLPDDQLPEVLRFVQSITTADRSGPSIEEKIAAIVDEKPKEIWKDVPADGARHHDRYIYGQPKQDR